MREIPEIPEKLARSAAHAALKDLRRCGKNPTQSTPLSLSSRGHRDVLRSPANESGAPELVETSGGSLGRGG